MEALPVCLVAPGSRRLHAIPAKAAGDGLLD